MKANRGSRILTTIAAAALPILAGSCAERQVVPPPAPAPAPAPRPSRPLPPPVPRADWRDVPITPGDWRWSMEGGQSVARFGNGLLVLRCDIARRTVSLSRPGGSGEEAVPLTVLTSSTTRQLSATALPGPPPSLTASFSGSDRLLDAIAFSRGRFAVETAGMPTLYVPSWPEVSRVVEDCR